MSYKFDSLTKILNKLDSGEVVTVQSLMHELEYSERTIHRYIRTLQDANFPIRYDRARETYSFSEGYCLRKPNLSVEETVAFALAKRVMSNFGSGMEKGLSSIEEKLSKKKVALPQHIILSADVSPGQNDKYLGIVHNAITNFQRIEIKYAALYSGEKTTRKVDPYYLFFQDGFWNLRAYCHLREDFRTFALDRITSLELTSQHFLPRQIDPQDDLYGSFGSVIDGEPVEVALKFDAEIEQHILRKKWHPSQTEKKLKDGSLEVRFMVNGYEGIKQWIYRWIPYIEILSPKELRHEVAVDMKLASEKNKSQ